MPDLTGTYCATLRRGLQYRLRRENVSCSCSTTALCHTEISLTDPGAAGVCTDATPSCQDNGPQQMECDFFCGS
jgi:hypothetical protein